MRSRSPSVETSTGEQHARRVLLCSPYFCDANSKEMLLVIHKASKPVSFNLKISSDDRWFCVVVPVCILVMLCVVLPRRASAAFFFR